MIQIYNTLGRHKQEFKPIHEGKVLMYQCGPTVYWTQHIGNMRAMIIADLIKRSFEYLGYEVVFTRNYTDVGHLTSDEDFGEDKMEKGAKRENLTPREIADKYISVFEKDVADLNTEEPTFKPLATNYVNEMIEMVSVLLEKGYAYSSDLAIYFDVSKVPNYTKLSGQNLEENVSGAGRAEVEDTGKKNPYDFAIWFFRAGKHKNALQYWNSPFSSPLVENGEGFPGWHMECSAMAKKLLGPTLDIHMGGIEHVPVHHTNEIAQSECANDAPLANFWVHNEHLTVDNGKMSKSIGTAFSLSEIVEKGFSPMDLRFFFLQAHYRSKQNFTWNALKASKQGLDNLKAKISELGSRIGTVDEKFKEDFIVRISDDFNIPSALAVVFEVVKSGLSNEQKLATILDFDKVLGLKLREAIQTQVEISEDIKKLIEERELARKSKDFAKADEIRATLLSQGIELLDGPDGVKVKKVS
ncbi:MAG: cysteine--tRNA ligase [Candidatus Gracilibacteria bacterium]|jgi:cysteinyl-tRNA synthetase|nr:cysteine--tRNA ligase [Candidatus Gracilibacteria bacterium]